MKYGNLLGLFVSALFMPALAACDNQSSEPRVQAPPSVVVAPARRTEVTFSFDYAGRAEANKKVNLRARVEGFLEQINFEEGGDVKQGDVLFVIEQEPYQVEVDRIAADVSRADASNANAQHAAQRAQDLFKRNATSQSALDDAITAASETGAILLQNKAALRKAELELSYTEVRAPFDGTIGRTEFNIGELVGPDSEPLAIIANLDPIYVKFGVSDEQMVQARQQGMASAISGIGFYLQLSDGQDYEHKGKVQFIDNEVNPDTDTVEGRASFPNPDRLLLPNQYVTIVVKTQEPQFRLVVSQTAVQEDQSGYFVLLVDVENRVQVRRVETSDRVGTDWVVSEGLEEGETVIVQGVQKVGPGMVVNPVIEDVQVQG